jgi:putative ABC transport system permease protein
MPEWKQEILKRLAGLKLEPAREAEIAEELSQHLEDRFRELVASGTEEAEARRLAQEELGSGDRMPPVHERTPHRVIPAKAGIHGEPQMDPRLRGGDDQAGGGRDTFAADRRRDAAATAGELVHGLRRAEREAPQEPVVAGGGGSGNFFSSLWQDVRYGLRQLRKNPGFTAVAILTLALGLGANTVIFSVVWRPLRYRDASRLLVVWETGPGGTRSTVSAPTYMDWRDQNSVFEQLAAARRMNVALSGNPPLLVPGARITANFFDTFQLLPESGRFFSSGDFRPNSGCVTVVSHELWQGHFAGEKSMAGKAIRLNGEPCTIIGVAPADFEFFGRVDFWFPLAFSGEASNRENRDLLVVGRERPGVTAARAREEMKGLAARTAQAFPLTNRHWSALTQNFLEALSGAGVQLTLIILFTIVTLVLLMACANVANVLLARGMGRQKEIAIRVALGASRWRVVRQLLAETLLLATLGGALGMLFAVGAVKYLATLPVLQAPGLAPIEINGTVLAFAGTLCLLATLLSGLIPAWRTTTVNLMEQVKSAARTATGDRKQSRLRNGLVSAELALCLILMVTAGLSLRSFIRLTEVDPGFPTQGLLAAHITLPSPQYADAGRARRFYSSFLEKVRSIPGVEDAAISIGLPPTPGEVVRPFHVEGRDPSSPAASGVADYQVVSPGYFRTLGLSLLKGRAFNADDRQGSLPVAIIDRRLAEKFFPGTNPLGKRLQSAELVPGQSTPSAPVALEIVGVVNDLRDVRMKERGNPEIYIPYMQAPWTSEYLLVRSREKTELIVAAVRDAMRAVDPDLPLTGIRTMDERYSDARTGGRVVVALMLIFAFMALAMGSAGLYGVVSYSVAQRTPEFAVRLALGAPKHEIRRLVANGVLRLLVVGGSIGMVGALGAANLLRSLIYGISAYDPVTFASVPMVLLVVVLAASFVPARRATRVDPMVALRCE